MWKNRIGYVGMVAFVAALLFFFGRPFLWAALVLLLMLPVIMAVLLRVDAGRIQAELQMRTGGRAGTELPADIFIKGKKNILVTGCMQIQLCIHNLMFDTEEERNLILEPVKAEEKYQMKVNMALCGEHVIQCRAVRIYDLLKLFHAELRIFPEVRTVIYPGTAELEIELENRSEGVLTEMGMMQNRKGNDPGEMFDIREYVPGDDIRAIHWKLSSKTDSLILRQPSAVMHYQVALMPDFCKDQKDEITAREWNMAAAILTAIGEQLLEMGNPFCILIPENGSLDVNEIRSRREFRLALSRWLGNPIQERGARGIRYFQIAHMEQYFTRLLTVTAGRKNAELETQMEEIRLVWFTASKDCHKLQVGKWKNNMIIEIPAEEAKKEVWHVVC